MQVRSECGAAVRDECGCGMSAGAGPRVRAARRGWRDCACGAAEWAPGGWEGHGSALCRAVPPLGCPPRRCSLLPAGPGSRPQRSGRGRRRRALSTEGRPGTPAALAIPRFEILPSWFDVLRDPCLLGSLIPCVSGHSRIREGQRDSVLRFSFHS